MSTDDSSKPAPDGLGALTHRSHGSAVRKSARRLVKSAFNLFGLDVVRKAVLTSLFAEQQFRLERNHDYQAGMVQDQLRAGMENLERAFGALYEKTKPYSMSSWERLYALYKATHYVVENQIPGDFVECGVWRGGSMRLAASVLVSLGDTSRKLYLYDTYEGMTRPQGGIDVDFSGRSAAIDWEQYQEKGVKWAYAPLEEVRETMASTGYPMERLVFVKGPVETTLPGTIPDRIDYGHYRGAARAVDEYLARMEKKPLLQRIDYTCRSGCKPTS